MQSKSGKAPWSGSGKKSGAGTRAGLGAGARAGLGAGEVGSTWGQLFDIMTALSA
jgi:hypothetical protein